MDEKIKPVFFKLSWKIKFILILVTSLFFVSVVGYILCLKPLLENKKYVHLQIAKLKIQLTGKQKSLSNYTAYEKALAFLRSQFFLERKKDKKINSEYSDKETLTRYSPSEIKMMGFLTNFTGKTWGLLRLPNNNFYKVELNDRLGLERGCVVLIEPKKIVIQEENTKKTTTLYLSIKE
jgi:Tfp pilus assembly protein PilP